MAQGIQNQASQLQLPNNYEAIIDNADAEIEKSSDDKLQAELNSGVFLNQNIKNRFLLFARDLKFTGGEWKWYKHYFVEVAELIEAESFEVHGEFNRKNQENFVASLPEILFQASFIIKIKKEACGWEDPMNLKLVLPNGNTISRQEILNQKTRDKWMELPIGKFKTLLHLVGGVKISVSSSGPHSKKGLVVLGAVIRPSVLKP